MARISTYSQDSQLQNSDRLLGTDANGAATNNFTLASLREFMNLGIDIRQETSPGYVPNVTEDGENVEQSRIRTETRTIMMNTLTLLQSEVEVFIDILANDDYMIEFVDPREDVNITFESFVNATFTGVLESGPTVTGTITAFPSASNLDGRDWILDENNRTRFVFDVSSNDFTANRLSRFSTITFTFPTGMVNVRETHLEGSTFTDGPLNILGGGSLESELNLPDNSGSLSFGTEPDRVLLTTNGSDIVTGGTGEVDLNNQLNATEDIVLDNPAGTDPNLVISGGNLELRDGGDIRRFDADGTELPPIDPVVANGSRDNDQGLLTHLQVGDDSWHLPTATSSVAQVIPGLLEELSALNTVDNYAIAQNAAIGATEIMLNTVDGLIVGTVVVLGGSEYEINRVVATPNPLVGIQNTDTRVTAPGLVAAVTTTDRFIPQFYTGQFFYGLDRGVDAQLSQLITQQPVPIRLLDNSTRFSIGTAGATADADQIALNTALRDAFSGATGSNRLFFGISTPNDIRATIAFIQDIPTGTYTVAGGGQTDTITVADGTDRTAYALTNVRTGPIVVTAPSPVVNFDFAAATDAMITFTTLDPAATQVTVTDGVTQRIIQATSITLGTAITLPTAFGRDPGAVVTVSAQGAAGALPDPAFTYVPPTSNSVTFRFPLNAGDVVSFTGTGGTAAEPDQVAIQGQTVFELTQFTAVTAVDVNGATPVYYRFTEFMQSHDDIRSQGMARHILLTTGVAFGTEFWYESVMNDSFDPTDPSVALRQPDFTAGSTPTTVLNLAGTPFINTGTPVRVVTRVPGTSELIPVDAATYSIVPERISGTATPGDLVLGPTFEVTNYNSIDFDTVTDDMVVSPGELEFSRLSVGNIQISTDRLTITSDIVLPNLPFGDATSQNLIFRDPNSGEISSSTLSTVFGAQAQVRYCPSDDATDLTNLSEIVFEGSTAAAGVITVGGGRFSQSTGTDGTNAVTRDDVAGGSGGFTSDIIVGAGDLVVLGPIGAVRTITLPVGTEGASIRFVNASTLGASAAANTALWRMIPDTTQRIVGLMVGVQELILNDRTANFDLVYANDQIGWMIID